MAKDERQKTLALILLTFDLRLLTLDYAESEEMPHDVRHVFLQSAMGGDFCLDPGARFQRGLLRSAALHGSPCRISPPDLP